MIFLKLRGLQKKHGYNKEHNVDQANNPINFR